MSARAWTTASVSSSVRLGAVTTATREEVPEIDVGLGRVGVRPGSELIELLQAIDSLPAVQVAGIAFYAADLLPALADRFDVTLICDQVEAEIPEAEHPIARRDRSA